MSCCTTTVSNSVRNSAPVGQASRHGAGEQCLQTSLIISQLLWKGCISVTRPPSPSFVPPPPALSPSWGGGFVVGRGDLLDEMDVPPRHRAEIAGIVVAVGAQLQIIGGREDPFLAGALAGLAADTKRRVGEKPVALSRLDAPPGSQLGL